MEEHGIQLNQVSGIIVDFQEKILNAMANKEEVKKRAVILTKGLHLLGVPMILTTQYAKGLGENIAEIKEAMGSPEEYDKSTFSVLKTPEIAQQLSTDRKYVILCGIEAHICVLQTALDLKKQGFEPIIVADCISSRKESDIKYALMRAQGEGILITSSEAILYELMGSAKHPAFREISALIK